MGRRIILLKDLIESDKKGYKIDFDIHPHPRIKNEVLINNKHRFDVSLSTYKAFNKYKLTT